MRRYWIEPSALSSNRGQVTIQGDELHHIRDVCRQRVGDRFEVIVEGKALFVEIFEETKKSSLARVLAERIIEPLPWPRIKLVLAIPRFPIFEAVLEKCVELGVESVYPVFSDNSFIRTNEKTWVAKESRFAKIIQSATQQCGRGELMVLNPTEKLGQLLSREFNPQTQNRGLFAYEADAEGLMTAKDSVSALVTGIRSEPPHAVWIFVGGEGGFSQDEVELFRAHALRPTTLGRQVLRVETACVALVSILKYELGLMR